MRIKRGTKARFTLTDGTTLAGIVRFSWGWFSWRVTEVTFYDARTGEPVAADGYFIIPKRSVRFVQVEGD